MGVSHVMRLASTMFVCAIQNVENLDNTCALAKKCLNLYMYIVVTLGTLLLNKFWNKFDVLHLCIFLEAYGNTKCANSSPYVPSHIDPYI